MLPQLFLPGAQHSCFETGCARTRKNGSDHCLQALDLRMFLLGGMIVGGSMVDVFSIGSMIDQVSVSTNAQMLAFVGNQYCYALNVQCFGIHDLYMFVFCTLSPETQQCSFLSLKLCNTIHSACK